MAENILYMAASGSGKTTSIRNFPVEQTMLITPNTKSLPFPGGDVKYPIGTKRIITNKLKGDSTLPQSDFGHFSLYALLKGISDKRPEIKYIVIDDFTHFFSARIFSQTFLAEGKGKNPYERWNVFGADVFQSIFEKADKLREDLYIIIMHHTELKDDGSKGFKSPGKLLDNTIDVPSYFNYVFHGFVRDTEEGAEYLIQTNKTENRLAKAPYGLFSKEELYVPNDLYPIIQRIEKYKKGELKVTWK